jgi:hypothetical protein
VAAVSAADRLIGKAHDYEVLAASHSEREALVGARATPDPEEKRYLRDLLGGPQPPGLDALRDALDDDLHDAKRE